MIKTLVIGSNSFSGSNFIDFLLSKNHIVYGVSRSNEYNSIFLRYKTNKNLKKFNFYQIDINKNYNNLINLIKEFKPNYIINFAAQGMVSESWENPDHWYLTNLVSLSKLTKFLQNNKFLKKMITFSTPEVYGSTPKMISENFNFKPSTPYANSRAAFDIHLKLLADNFGFPIIFTRTSNVYGPHQQLYRIIPKTIISINKNIKLPLHGGGSSKRSFIFIDDVSTALYKILVRGKIGETYHISTNHFISIKNLVSKICKNENKSFSSSVNLINERIGKDQEYRLNSSKLRNQLNWRDRIDLDTGLLITQKWIKDNFIKLSKISLNYKHKK